MVDKTTGYLSYTISCNNTSQKSLYCRDDDCRDCDVYAAADCTYFERLTHPNFKSQTFRVLSEPNLRVNEQQGDLRSWRSSPSTAATERIERSSLRTNGSKVSCISTDASTILSSAQSQHSFSVRIVGSSDFCRRHPSNHYHWRLFAQKIVKEPENDAASSSRTRATTNELFCANMAVVSNKYSHDENLIVFVLVSHSAAEIRGRQCFSFAAQLVRVPVDAASLRSLRNHCSVWWRKCASWSTQFCRNEWLPSFIVPSSLKQSTL
jgi:hypothetical protein